MKFFQSKIEIQKSKIIALLVGFALAMGVVPVRAANDVIVGFHGAGHFTGTHATVTTTASKLVNIRTTRRSIFITNLDASITIYVGATSSVTAANGTPITAGNWLSVDSTAAIYLISSSGAAEVSYLEVYD